MKENKIRTVDEQQAQYERELQEQRDKLIAENPDNAWMIEAAYEITRNPYRRKRGRRF